MTTVTLEQIAEEDDKYLVTDGDVGLGSNHPKLQAFQTAVKAALTKRVREAEEELFRLKKVYYFLSNSIMDFQLSSSMLIVV